LVIAQGKHEHIAARVPEGIDIQKVEAKLYGIDGVKNVHDLHIWALTSGKSVMSVHLVADSFSAASKIFCPK
jgi:cobalt-zinc-cadmium efflux system protein